MNQEQREQVEHIRNNAKKMIWITFQREGIHYYPAALTDPKLATGDEYDVSFLGHPHRHIFYFKVWIEVFHDDRDLEFIQFKRWCESLYTTDGVLKLDYQSCEMISDALYLKIANKYPGRDVKISVAEDNENGSETEYTATQSPDKQPVIFEEDDGYPD